jgi:hypothetical protein
VSSFEVYTFVVDLQFHFLHPCEVHHKMAQGVCSLLALKTVVGFVRQSCHWWAEPSLGKYTSVPE